MAMDGHGWPLHVGSKIESSPTRAHDKISNFTDAIYIFTARYEKWFWSPGFLKNNIRFTLVGNMDCKTLPDLTVVIYYWNIISKKLYYSVHGGTTTASCTLILVLSSKCLHANYDGEHSPCNTWHLAQSFSVPRQARRKSQGVLAWL